MADLRAELAEMMDQVEWDWLQPHAKRDALIVVTAGMDLLDVGSAIARDEVTTVQRWIGEQLIYKPSTDQLNIWNQNPHKAFVALIVQPYVLAQEQSG